MRLLLIKTNSYLGLLQRNKRLRILIVIVLQLVKKQKELNALFKKRVALEETLSEIENMGEYTIEAKQLPLSVVKWDPGTYLNLHVDDLGYVTDNHIPVHIYLNDDYEGGEVGFPTHNLLIKPKVGDFNVFPGNMHYAHEVKKVLSGTRYTLPIWFSIV